MFAVVRWFASQSLRAKLLWTNLVVVILSLATAMAVVAGSEWHHAKKMLLDDASTQARVLGGTASAALVFDDADGAGDILGALRLSPHVLEGAVFRPDGTELAHYRRFDRMPLPPLALPAQPYGHVFGESFLELAEPIHLDRALVGYIVLRNDLDVARERLRWTAIASAGAAAVALAVASLLAWLLRDVVAGPILRLAQVAREISEVGDYGRRARIEGRDEAGMLARDFNSMIEQIERRNEVLKESEARFRLMADCAPVLIWVAGTDKACSWFNQPWLDFTGRSIEQELDGGWVEGVHPDDVGRCLRHYHEAFDRREKFVMEYRLRRHDGEYRWVIDQAAPRFEADGNFAGYVGACFDVTDQKEASAAIERLNAELESRVQERTAELVAANRELEGFTFATSHDLRGPLGRINSFSKLLEQKYADRLSGDGLLFLDFIRQNATRLTQLVDDLLSHARVTRQAAELQVLDPAALVHAVVREKAEDIRERGATVAIEVPPGEVLGDSCALTQVLDNLVGNALKYSSSERPPVILISGAPGENGYLLAVQDNGIGFDMAYHDRIFEMFHRLHTYHEYEGSGIGLALVKRAMERMGGKVWAESQPNRGATFFLELQRASGFAAVPEGLQ